VKPVEYLGTRKGIFERQKLMSWKLIIKTKTSKICTEA
jgi:hypothetical protein